MKQVEYYKNGNRTLRIKYEGIKKLLEKKDKEIERLNNIIKILEKEINSQLTMTRRLDKYNEGYFDATLNYYNKLQELKGDGSNE